MIGLGCCAEKSQSLSSLIMLDTGDYLLMASRRDWARSLAMHEWVVVGETVE